MPMKKVLTADQKGYLTALINDHVNGQAAIAAIVAVGMDKTSEAVRTVVQKGAMQATSALNHYLDLISEEPTHTGAGSLSETAELQPPGGPLGSDQP